MGDEAWVVRVAPLIGRRGSLRFKAASGLRQPQDVCCSRLCKLPIGVSGDRPGHYLRRGPILMVLIGYQCHWGEGGGGGGLNATS